MKRCINLALIFPILLTIGLPIASVQAQPHTHGDRTHNHGLPAQGLGHKHGNTPPGRAVGGQKPAPRAQQQRQQNAPARPKNTTPNNNTIAGDPNVQLKQAYKQKNYKRVFQIASQFAKQGDPSGQFVLGQLALLGQGQKKNPKVAFNWLNKAAAQGHQGAQYLVGTMYASGQGTKKNFGQAHKNLKLAADKGVPDAMASLGFMYQNGQGVKKNLPLAIR